MAKVTSEWPKHPLAWFSYNNKERAIVARYKVF